MEDSLFMSRGGALFSGGHIFWGENLGGQTFYLENLGGQTVFGENFGSGYRTFSHEKCTKTT